MDITGTAVTDVTVKVLPGFKPDTNLAIYWRKLSSGNYSGLDRGSASDYYDANVFVYGKESVINNLIGQIYNNRFAESNVVTLSNFFDTEYIFGENVDHSGSISATVLEIGERRQGSFKGWGVSIKFRALSPSFTGSTSFPSLTCCDVPVISQANYTILKSDSYTGVFAYSDHLSDSNIFEGIFTVSRADMILLRNYIKSQRTGNFTLSDTFGVSEPFGPITQSVYPFTTKLIEWEDLGYYGLKYSKIRLRFAEVYS